jgi:integrase
MAPGRRAKRVDVVMTSLSRFSVGEGLGAPPVLVAEVIEAFVAKGLSGRTSSTRGTYRCVLRQAGGPASVSGRRGIPFSAAPAPHPYAQAERAELMAVALAQPKPWRRHSALALLALGLGAGLRSGEIVAARRADVIGRADTLSIGVLGATSRTVTLRPPYGDVLAHIMSGAQGDHLFHPEEAERTYPNFVNDFCRGLVADPAAVKLSVTRARSSYICDHLGAGTDLSVLLAASGIKEVESLLRYAVHVEGAPHSKAALRHQLVTERP